MKRLHRFLPLLTLLALLVAAWASGLTDQLGWDALARHQAGLTRWVGAHPIVAPLAYAALYVAVAALSLPEAALVTIAGGLLFGTILGGALAVIGATLGAIVLFLFARSAFAELAQRRGGALLARARDRIAARRILLPAGDPADPGVPVLAGESGRCPGRDAAAALRHRHAARHHTRHAGVRLDRRRAG